MLSAAAGTGLLQGTKFRSKIGNIEAMFLVRHRMEPVKFEWRRLNKISKGEKAKNVCVGPNVPALLVLLLTLAT
jgi:hypothetical protein